MPIHEPSEKAAWVSMLEVRNESLAQGLSDIFEIRWSQAEPIE
jgi:hypothetical protein